MKVFLSYAQTDKTLAKIIVDGLKKAGFDVWEEMNEILPGDNWADKTAKALRESQAMVVLLTPEALQSPYVQHEIGYALGSKSYKKRLIPVIIGSPDSIPEEQIPWILQRFQTVRFPRRGNREESIKQIAQKLLEAA
jgi:hypothetical protein